MANGGCRVEGKCPSCGGKVSRIVSVNDAPDNVRKQCLANKAKKRGSGRRSARGSGKKRGRRGAKH